MQLNEDSGFSLGDARFSSLIQVDVRLINQFRFLKFHTKTKASISRSGEKTSRKSIFYQFRRASKVRCKFSLNKLKLHCISGGGAVHR